MLRKQLGNQPVKRFDALAGIEQEGEILFEQAFELIVEAGAMVDSFATLAHMEVLFDDERLRYMAVWVGWWKSKRIHQCTIHIDICDDMVIIQCNDTEDLIGTELANMGIPKEKICLGFLPPETHSYTTPDMIAKPYVTREPVMA